MAPITIHGNEIDPSHEARRSRDAAETNYIYIQGSGALTAAQIDQLLALGAEPQRYEGDDTWLCRYLPSDLAPLRALPFVRHANAYHKAFKTAAHLKEALQETERVHVTIAVHRDARSGIDIVDELRGIAGVHIDTVQADESNLSLHVDPTAIPELERIDDVRHIELRIEDELTNDLARTILLMEHVDSLPADSRSSLWDGKGQLVTVADSGFDNGTTGTSGHPAFAKTAVKLVAVGRADAKAPDSNAASLVNDTVGHGTHVAASIVGSGVSYELGGSKASGVESASQKAFLCVQGTAVAADLCLQSLLTARGGLATPHTDDQMISQLLQPAYDAGSRIHNNSWGKRWPAANATRAEFGPFAYQGEGIDKFVNEHPDFIVVFAAGNDGGKPDRSGQRTVASQIGGYAAAKNCITVGASQSPRPSDGYTYDPKAAACDTSAIAAFSSRGPTYQQGRSKPDLVAPGTTILSARSQDPAMNKARDESGAPTEFQSGGGCADGMWAFSSGTSMATPLVTGCVAVLRQALMASRAESEQTDRAGPSAALIKALLIHHATPLSGTHQMATSSGPQTVTYGEPPDPNYGYGRVNVAAALGAVTQTRDAMATANNGLEDSAAPLKQGEVHTLQITQPDQATSFKVTMTYSDRPGANIQNYLHLRLKKNGVERSAPAAPEDNVQQVIWTSVSAGQLSILVDAIRIVPGFPQPFALVWSWS